MKWVENPEVSGLNPNTKTLGNFFPFVLALVDRVTWYLLLVGGDRYSVELVKVRENLPRHHDHKKVFLWSKNIIGTERSILHLKPHY